jgi:hypothetical protein
MFSKTMNKFLLSCLAFSLVAGAAQAQTAAPPPAAGAKPPVQTVPKRTAAPANQILEYGSFELPRVQERKPKLKGGNFLLFTSDEWMDFHGEPDSSHGSLVIGLTNEVARTGRQSMYVEFSKLRKARAEAVLASQLIAIKPDQPYRVGIWGRMDKKQALTLDQPLPMLRLQVDFFQSDGETQTGDQVFRAQPMPGSRDRPPFFVSKEWREYYADMQTPEDAGFLKITWSWTSPQEPGEINGVMYFDDATLVGEKVEVPEEPPEPAPDGTPAVPAPAPAAPTPTDPAPTEPAPPAAEVKATPAPKAGPVPKAAPAATPAAKPRTKPK